MVTRWPFSSFEISQTAVQMSACYSSIIKGSIFILLSFPTLAQGQSHFLEERAEEDYQHLKDSIKLAWQDAFKYIALDKQKNTYLSIGGTFRPRYEHFTNSRWIKDNDESYYSQRLAFHADLHIGTNLLFLENFSMATRRMGKDSYKRTI